MTAIRLAALFLAGSTAAAGATPWTVDSAKSSVTFTGTQTGQPFMGRFKTFAATIDFDPAKPEAAHVLVTVDTGSAVTGDQQKDEALPGADWFDVSSFPKATFEATGFKALGGDKYEADGTLTIRDVKKPLVLPFTLTTANGTAHAVGAVDLLRSAYGVGQGSWATEDYVAFPVKVGIDITASAAK